jgi:hypothetical protein
MAGGSAHEWIEVDQKDLDLATAKQESEGGVYIRLFVSPHDVPDAFRGYWDEDKQRFIIEFRYLDAEPWRLEPGEGAVRLRLGKHSRRISGIEVDTERLEADAVLVQVSSMAQSAHDSLASRPSRPPSPNENYRLAKDLVAQLAGRLRPEPGSIRPSYAH